MQPVYSATLLVAPGPGAEAIPLPSWIFRPSRQTTNPNAQRPPGLGSHEPSKWATIILEDDRPEAARYLSRSFGSLRSLRIGGRQGRRCSGRLKVDRESD